MKFIQLYPLKYRRVAVVDDEDYVRVTKHRWHIDIRSGQIFTYIRQRRLPLGNYILDLSFDTLVDHKDRRPDNNCRSNLRIATQSQNRANRRMSRQSKSGYIGVEPVSNQRYKGYINVNGKRISLGQYSTGEEAAIARDKAAREFHGDFAVLNFPNEESDDE